MAGIHRPLAFVWLSCPHVVCRILHGLRQPHIKVCKSSHTACRAIKFYEQRCRIQDIHPSKGAGCRPSEEAACMCLVHRDDVRKCRLLVMAPTCPCCRQFTAFRGLIGLASDRLKHIRPAYCTELPQQTRFCTGDRHHTQDRTITYSSSSAACHPFTPAS